jgi:DNA modification methylase
MPDNPTLFDHSALPVEKKSAGPPNRMNDLKYGDWMKFQKSFFRFVGWDSLLKETVLFFTKEQWENGEYSRTLLCGFSDVPTAFGKRILTTYDSSDVELCLDFVGSLPPDPFDFVFMNLTQLTAAWYAKNISTLKKMFSQLAELLRPGRYAGLVIDFKNEDSFPLPWAVAQLGRPFLKLRDERVGLVSDELCRYCLFFENKPESNDGEEWLLNNLQVSVNKTVPRWIFPKSPPRKPDEISHPAKFPERLVTEFIELFTEPGNTVLDPMVGTGSAAVAAVRIGRNGYGIELNGEFAAIATRRLAAEHPVLIGVQAESRIVNGDARKVADFFEKNSTDYSITSPPYWSMLSNEGSENQRLRREKSLKTVYSDEVRDVGNVESYKEFVGILTDIYFKVAEVLHPGGHLTVIVKNVKREHVIYPLAWDLVRILAATGRPYRYVGTTLWCQDDVSLKPFAVGIHWVSNTLHTYCLHFERC